MNPLTNDPGPFVHNPNPSGRSQKTDRMNQELAITVGESEVRLPIDDVLIDLDDPEDAAHLLGFKSVSKIEDLVPKEDRPYIRAALLNLWTMQEALHLQFMEGKNIKLAGAEQRVAVILERAQVLRRANEDAKRWAAINDADQTCAITGRVDPTTTVRRLPWRLSADLGDYQPVRCSDDGLAALFVAWLAAADPADVERAHRYLIAEGVINPPAKASSKR